MNIIKIAKFLSIILGLIVAIPLLIDCPINPIISVILIIVIYISYMIFCTSIKRKLNPCTNSKSLEEILKSLGSFEKVEINKNLEEAEIKKLKLFNGYFDTCRFDDCINGSYKNLEVRIREISLRKIERVGKRTHIIPIFNGIFIKMPCNKNFKGYTLINGRCDDLEKIQLEDINFSSSFNVQGTDQIEARYLLTTAFINRMMELRENRIVQCFSLSFEKGYIYIALHMIGDSFSSGSCEDEINTIFSIIDTLKLDQNIGM